MAAVKAFSNQANGLYPRFLIYIYIYIYIESDFNEYTSNRGTVILHLVQGATIKKVAPYNWHHANWDPMKQFIKAEIESGRFIPNFPLDF